MGRLYVTGRRGMKPLVGQRPKPLRAVADPIA
jgi:hypothetical protein